jgi:hypothetical protein
MKARIWFANHAQRLTEYGRLASFRRKPAAIRIRECNDHMPLLTWGFETSIPRNRSSS